ncbi:MAG: hypothetical protein LBS83_02915 [Holosporales bacterium]|nr:hypothetical protein [Holosporales bacterium]
MGKFVISPKPHEDSSIEATNKFAEEIGFKGSLLQVLAFIWTLLVVI